MRGRRTARPARVLLHPAFSGAVMVLAVNDVWLKDRFGSWWTGKLSDIAGLFVVAVLAGLFMSRPLPAAGATALGFGLLKLVPGVAAVAAPMLGGVTLRDPADLVALVALYPAVRLLEVPPATPATRASSASSVVRTVLAGAGGAVAVLAVTATSCSPPDLVDRVVAQDDGSVLVRIVSSAPEHPPTSASSTPEHPPTAVKWAISRDGGLTWDRTAQAPTPSRPGSEEAAHQPCLANGTCFRLAGERVEERSAGAGQWTESFAFSAEQRRRIRIRVDNSGCATTTRGEFAAIAVAARPDGDHVIVAMGAQGVLHRTPNGEWQRRAVLGLQPISVRGPSWLHTIRLAPLVVLALSPILLLVSWSRRSGRAWVSFLLCATAAVGLLVVDLFHPFLGLDYTANGPSVAIVSIVMFAACVVFAFHRGRQPPQPPPTGPT